MDFASELNELATKFGSDKVTLGYMPLYAEYFKRHGFQKYDPINILEIGTNKGSSLRVWAEAFPNATVHGLDITRHYEIPSLLECQRIKTDLADQGDRESLESAVLQWPSFDLIIDDGSHDQADQQVSLGFLFRYRLKSGGLYVVEDIITGENWWDGNLYNKRRVIATRNLLQIFAQTCKMESPVMTPAEISHLQENYIYCDYRESKSVIYGTHHPQIAFMGKR